MPEIIMVEKGGQAHDITQQDNAEPVGGACPRPGKHGLPFALAVLCLVMAALGLRPTIVSVGPILPQIVSAFGMTHVQASMLTAIPTLLMGLLALPTPWIASRYGRNRVIVAALLLLACASLVRAFSTSSWLLLLSTAVTGVGIAFAGTLIPGFMKARFPTRVALLMGIYATSLSIGSAVAAAATGFLADQLGGWRPALGFWALPALFGAGAWMIGATRERFAQPAPKAGTRIRLPVRNPLAWRVAAFFACNNVIFYGCIAWLTPIYIELGRSSVSAGLIMASFNLAFTVGTFLVGMVSRHLDRRFWLAISAGLALAGLAWMAIAPTTLPFVAASLTALGIGGSFTLAMTLPLDNAGTHEEATAWNAFVLLVSYLVGACGPLLVGVLRDLTGGFAASLTFLAISSGAMLALTPFLHPHHLRVRKP